MTTQIKCPHCKKSFEPSEAYKHQIKEATLAKLSKKHDEELENVKKETAQKTQESLSKDLKDKDGQIDALKKRAEKAEEEELKIRKEKRELKEEKEKFEVEKERQLDKERESIKKKAIEKYDEDHELKDKEKEKKLSDALKQIGKLKSQIEQGSQQTQGEVLELELEGILEKEFPTDNIKEIKKGQRGADVLQEVIDKKGRKCGNILWESKNAKWSNGWISKLREDQRQAKADLAILVVTDPPEGIETFDYRDGVWIVVRKMIIPLALSLRYYLVRVTYEKLANTGKKEKTEVLFQYITSTEFKHRVEAIVEAFGGLQEIMEKEKRWFQTKWAKQEKELRKVVDHTQGMYGDLQSVIGKSLPDIKSMELESGEEEK